MTLNTSYTLYCLTEEGLPHPLYPPTDGWTSDPLSIRRPILLLTVDFWGRGGAKKRRERLGCSQTVAEQNGEPLALHLPEGTTEVVIKNEHGYCAHYAIDVPEGIPVLIPVPGHDSVGASVCADPLKVGWRYLWWWDTLPGSAAEPFSEMSDHGGEADMLRGTLCVCAARDAGLLPGLKTDGYRVLGVNMRPGFARLLQPRVKPQAAVMKARKDRRR